MRSIPTSKTYWSTTPSLYKNPIERKIQICMGCITCPRCPLLSCNRFQGQYLELERMELGTTNNRLVQSPASQHHHQRGRPGELVSQAKQAKWTIDNSWMETMVWKMLVGFVYLFLVPIGKDTSIFGNGFSSRFLLINCALYLYLLNGYRRFYI